MGRCSEQKHARHAEWQITQTGGKQISLRTSEFAEEEINEELSHA